MALCAWGGREGCTRLQERDSCGGSWRPLGPATSSHAPREGKALSTRTPGAQGLHRRPGKTSPSSLPGSLDSDRVKTSRWERSKEGLSLTSGGGASSCLFPPRADLPAQPRGTARQRQPEQGNVSQRHPLADQEDPRREPQGLAPTRPRWLSWRAHSLAFCPATPVPSQNQTESSSDGRDWATVCALPPPCKQGVHVGEELIPT